MRTVPYVKACPQGPEHLPLWQAACFHQPQRHLAQFGKASVTSHQTQQLGTGVCFLSADW